MKSSTIPFCPVIPESWTEVPNKHLFTYHSSKVGDDWRSYQLLSLTTSGVRAKDINSSGGKVPESYAGYQTVDSGDMIFCLFDLDVSAVFSGLSSLSGMITSAYDVVRPNGGLLYQKYADYWFQYVFSRRYYKIYSKNIRYTIGSDMFGSIKTPVPPMKEQIKIGEYLDKKCSEIDSLIAVEEAQIAKLRDYKIASIGKVIKQGVEEGFGTKTTTCGWFPVISHSGTITIVGRIYDVILGKMVSPEKTEEDETLEPYYCAANVHLDSLDDEVLKEMWFSPVEKSNYLVKDNDLLIVEGGAGAGGAHILSHPRKAYIQNSIMIARGGGYFENKWLYYNLYFLVKNGYIDYICNKATIPHFTKDKLRSTEIVVYPKEDIVKLVGKLDALCANIDSLLEIKKKKIALLTDFKKSLIYEYVVGKKEVTLP